MAVLMHGKITVLAAVAVGAFLILSLSLIPNTESFGTRRDRLIDELSLAIDDAIASGNYECCIDPPCDMCYLGHWIWENGTCLCDEMIAKGELDKVCPQCVKGMEQGLCESTKAETCPAVQ